MNEQLAGLRPAQRDALRLVGATLFASGALAIWMRKTESEQWAAFPKLLVLAIPCVLLYGLGIGALRIGRPDDDDDGAVRDPRGLAAWRSAALVLALVLVPLTLAQLIDTLGGDPSAAGHTTWLFLATAAAGFYAAFGRGLRWGALFGGLALIVGWISLWDAIVDPSATAIRWLFLLIALGLGAAAYRLHRDAEGPELATAAGVAGLLAGITGLLSVADNVTSGVFGLGGDSGSKHHQEWDVFLLLLALVLIWYGTRAAWRGPVYVGALTLFAFILSVSFEVTALLSGEGPTGDVVGWPLLLLVLGCAGLLAGLFAGGDDRTATAPADTAPTEAMPPPGAPPTAPPPPPPPQP